MNPLSLMNPLLLMEQLIKKEIQPWGKGDSWEIERTLGLVSLSITDLPGLRVRVRVS